MIELRRGDFSVDEVLSKLVSQDMGGLVTFVGVVRGESRGKSVEQIEIQVFEDMARKQLEEIRREALERFKVNEVSVIHRYGNLQVSDKILIIAVGAPHRADAFNACRYVLENIKRRVPIWKKEITPEGEFWVEGDKP